MAGTSIHRHAPPPEVGSAQPHRPTGGRVAGTAALASLGLQFMLELVALGALAYWGFTTGVGATRWALGLGAPALAITLWALFGAPRAPFHAHGPRRVVVELVFFGAAVAALAAAGEARLALALGLLTAANIALFRLLGHDG